MLPAFKSPGLLDAIARFEDKLCDMVREQAGQLIPSGEVDEWLNIVVSEVSVYLPVKTNMLKSEINDLLLAESSVTPTFDPFLPLAQTSNTMLTEDGAHFPADPFISVITHYFPPSKLSTLTLAPKNASEVPSMGIHNKDLDRLNAAAAVGLGPNAIAPIEPTKSTSKQVQVKVAPVVGKPNTGVGASAGATVVQRPAPTVIVKCARAKVKSAEFVDDSDVEFVGSDEEAPAGKKKKEAIQKGKKKEAPAPKKKKEGTGVQNEDSDDEYDDEEDVVPKKGKKRIVPELYDLTPAKEGEVQSETRHMPTNPNEPIIWDIATLTQAIADEEWEMPNGVDRYQKEARKWEEKEKVIGMTRKLGGKGGKRRPFYWGPHDELDYEGGVSFEVAYDPAQNPIDDHGIRRYLVADVFTTPCNKCTAAGKPCFFAGGESSPLGRRGMDELVLNKGCACCKESRHKCPGHSRLRQRTIIDNPFYNDEVKMKKAKSAKPAPKPAPKRAPTAVAPKAEAPAAAKVAGPSKPTVGKLVKGTVLKFSMPDAPSQMFGGRF